VRLRFDYPHVASTLALVIAISTGAAFAINVTSDDIVDNTIRSIDVRQDALSDKDINEGSLGFPKSFTKGQLYRGVIGARDNVGSSTGSVTAVATIPADPGLIFNDTRVEVKGGSDDQGRCKGTFLNPVAPQGVVCVYPGHIANATNIRGLGTEDLPLGVFFGFRIAWEPTAANALTLVEATWAVRALGPD
jgi:hypothetical protein